MASQETPNYRLSRWAGTDRILVEEFNDNWDKIDTALKGNADAVAAETAAREAGISALQTALTSCGNCKIVTGSYTGNGKTGAKKPIILNFPGKPLSKPKHWATKAVSNDKVVHCSQN